MSDNLIYSEVIKTDENYARDASLLFCPRCDSGNLHHIGVTVFDRQEDAATVVKTEVAAGRVSVDPKNTGIGNPSARRDGITIDFRCEGCGDGPITLTIAQHKGSTLIGWVFPPE